MSDTQLRHVEAVEDVVSASVKHLLNVEFAGILEPHPAAYMLRHSRETHNQLSTSMRSHRHIPNRSINRDGQGSKR